jgi:pimeloyl-ACP methyl ester carboxylesterase
MPAVFVHGVPETPAIWEALRSKLARDDVIAVQLPGFGCPRPPGFGATKEEYVTWLVGELEKIAPQGPIDLVGHDWGGGFVVRLVSTRADLVRSWVCDAAGLGDVNFEWHDFAKIWQTPGEGEKFYADNLAIPADERGAAVLEEFWATLG